MFQIGCERKEKSTLKCKTERAANLGKLQNGKAGENCSLCITPPLLWAIETALIIKTMNSEKHIHIVHPLTLFCLVSSLLHLVINYEFSETGSAFVSVLTMQNRSFWSLILASVVTNSCIVSQWHL